MLVVAGPRFRNLQKLLAACDAITREPDHQAVRRFARAEVSAFPGEGPVRATRARGGIGFFGKESPLTEVLAHFCLEESFCGGEGLLAFQRFCRAGFLNPVLKAYDVARGADPDFEFLFLLRAEKADFPIPDVERASHESVGLLEA